MAGGRLHAKTRNTLELDCQSKMSKTKLGTWLDERRCCVLLVGSVYPRRPVFSSEARLPTDLDRPGIQPPGAGSRAPEIFFGMSATRTGHDRARSIFGVSCGPRFLGVFSRARSSPDGEGSARFGVVPLHNARESVKTKIAIETETSPWETLIVKTRRSPGARDREFTHGRSSRVLAQIEQGSSTNDAEAKESSKANRAVKRHTRREKSSEARAYRDHPIGGA
ncbi:fructuronate reductase [Anopheles sinensis]|uniref:Fructuronate reductase n=1 Tax=Anopheles sinensis TaxID=74873 RepID=A0A084VR94_ANOSI|nr:fructuronate reductase [Anopheles sinensis]